MSKAFYDNIKLSVPETAGRSIHIWDSHYQEHCPEEPPQSIKSYDVALQPFKSEPFKYCSADEYVLCPMETSEPVRLCEFGPQKKKSKSKAHKKIRSPITECTDVVQKSYLRVKISEMLFKLCLDYNSPYYNLPWRQPTSRPFILSLYGVLQKLDAFYRDLFSASFVTSLLMLKVVLISLFQGAASETHSLRYYHTGVLQQDDCPFKFEAVGFVNDQQIDKYDYDAKRDVPVAPWMENHSDKNYWDRETNYRQGWEKVFRDNLRILRNRLNDSSIFLTLQLMYGCERNDDANATGHYQYAVNGKDFLYLDDKSLLWQAAMYEAQISADRWNTDLIIAKSVKDYLTQHCTNALEKYISLGEQELTRKVRPEVKVWGRTLSNGLTRLQCLVYGFHPRAVDVKWMKNGDDHVPSDEMTPILPHPDGTYQIRVGLKVLATEENAYSCHVEHTSLEETLTVKAEPNKSITRVHVILLSVSLTSVIAMVFLIKLFKAKWTPKFYSTDSTMSSSA